MQLHWRNRMHPLQGIEDLPCKQIYFYGISFGCVGFGILTHEYPKADEV